LSSYYKRTDNLGSQLRMLLWKVSPNTPSSHPAGKLAGIKRCANNEPSVWFVQAQTRQARHGETVEREVGTEGSSF